MGNIAELLQLAERKCLERGVKLTSRRREVLIALLEAEGALSAYELLDKCNKQSLKPMPAMSMYRILQFLEDHLLVHKLSSANKYVACGHIGCEHQHFFKSQFLICSDCSAVKEISIADETYKAMMAAADQAGFTLEGTQIEVTGSCNHCRG